MALAKRDGWTQLRKDITSSGREYIHGRTAAGDYSNPPDYTASYDAIIPLVHRYLDRHTCHAFFDSLGLIAIVDWQDFDGAPSYEGDGSYFEMWVLYKATPSQICEALLQSLGLWTTE